MRRSTTARHVVAFASALLAACTDWYGPVAPEKRDDQFGPQFALQSGSPDMAALARSVPGFGGLFLDDQGVPTVYLKDPAMRAAATPAVSSFLQAHGIDAANLRVLQGDYDYLELERWFSLGSPAALELAGVVFIDLDEAANRVVIGVLGPAAASQARAALTRLRVPDEAVQFVVTAPIQLTLTLRDQVRPTVGGLQINFGQYLCTLGFNASHSGGNSFITNSHCTNKQGGTEGTLYYQPLASAANSFIGTEELDPTYFRGGVCPKGKRCRYSDSARIRYDASASFTLGQLAKTTGVNNGSLTIAGAFSITGEADPIAGQTANKIGRTTGWTAGTIIRTCINVGVLGTNIVQLCQSQVSAGVGAGDSGSPVAGLSGDNATLLGILWGGGSDGSSYVFSPMSGIERELGALGTH